MVFNVFRCQLDLSKLSREKTHKLELELEEDKGTLVLLVTLTATVAVSISDLSVNRLDDPHERQQILKRYVSVTSTFLTSTSGSLITVDNSERLRCPQKRVMLHPVVHFCDQKGA